MTDTLNSASLAEALLARLPYGIGLDDLPTNDGGEIAMISYCPLRCGGGKTLWSCSELARLAGRYVLAVDRRDVIATRRNLIEAFARHYGTTPLIGVICSRSDEHPRARSTCAGRSVQRGDASHTASMRLSSSRTRRS